MRFFIKKLKFQRRFLRKGFFLIPSKLLITNVFFGVFFSLKYFLFRSFNFFLLKSFFFNIKPVNLFAVKTIFNNKILYHIFFSKYFFSIFFSIPFLFYRFHYLKNEFLFINSKMRPNNFLKFVSLTRKSLTNLF